VLDGLREQGVEGSPFGVGERCEDLIVHAQQRPVQVCEKVLTLGDSAMIARRRPARSRRRSIRPSSSRLFRTATRLVASMPVSSASIC